MGRVKQPEPKQFKANLAPDIMSFLTDQAQRFGSSVNSEITRAVRERMDRVQAAAGEVFGDKAPTAARNTAALQGGDIIHNG